MKPEAHSNNEHRRRGERGGIGEIAGCVFGVPGIGRRV